MFKKVFAIAAIFLFQQLTFSQAKDETCDTPAGDPALDLNSITKCSVESKDGKAKKISVEVTSRRRVIRKRNAVTGVNSSSATSNKLAELKKKASLVGNLDLSSEEVVEKIPFNLVEEIPLFEDCEKVAIFKQEKCFNKMVRDHINRNFSYPGKAYDASIQGRVLVQFVIDKNGDVADLNVRGPYKGELLEKEAVRIIKKLPKFKPGKHNGKNVKVKYGVPINFRIPGKRPSNVKRVKKIPENTKDIFGFKSVDSVPLFSDCNSKDSQSCFNVQFSKFINENFAYPEEAKKKNIQGKVTASFIVDTNGDIVNIRAKGPEGGKILEDALVSILSGMPKLKPAIRKGVRVKVRYSFPINFALNK
ncbi:energy transducer TonB [Tenacibaculum jejuense]|uniref:TonB family protein n=1 Tax=Tenacibaculum jejuense TaxID=584609 RepID=A0A238U886_9FLAO|nr:energy transducer TonB [Tenacibaculum jejuense]SNR15255.1 TonB family protein precursor [Tenacibaculum jejuense]